MTEKTAERKPPPWDWRPLSRQKRKAELEELARWVDGLQQRYRAVRLPACWPCHDGLRAELMFFWYWEEQILEPGAVAEEGVRWHDHLRRAAQSWAESYLGCDHVGRKMDEEARPLQVLSAERAGFTASATERALGLGEAGTP